MRQFLFNLLVAMIFILGMVAVFSATSADLIDHHLEDSLYRPVMKQMGAALLGSFFAYLVYRLGYHQIIVLSPILLIFFCALLVLVLIPGVGAEVNGAKRWIRFAGLTIQPSEFVRYLLPIAFIERRQKCKETLWGFITLMAPFLVPLILIFLEPNNGTVAVLSLSLLFLLFLTHVPFRFWVLPLLIFCSMGVLSLFLSPYVASRIESYRHPENDLLGKGHQAYQAKVAVGSGGLLGKGPGNSWQKLSFLPEAQNDYIAAIYAEEFGFVGIALLLASYAGLGLLGFAYALDAKDPLGFSLAGALTFLFCLHAFLNLAVVSGLLPSTGLNLPLFSQGGSSLVANLCALSLILSVGKKERADCG